MHFDIAIILYLIIGFLLLIPLGIAGAAINQLMAIRIQRPHLVLKDKSDLPNYLNDVFENGIKSLEEIGFEYHHCQYSLDIVCHQHNDKWSVVLVNKQNNVYAEISPASTFLDLPGYEIDFWSIASDGSALITMNGRGHTILCGITNAEIHDPMSITLADVYHSHLTERDDVFGKKPIIEVNEANYVKVQQKLFDGYFLNLMNERAVISTGHNQFRMAFSKARRLLPQVLRGQKRLRKLLHDKLVWQETQTNKASTDKQISVPSKGFSVEAEVQSYLRMRAAQERTPGGISARLILFFLVLSLTYMAFGLSFSLYSIIILISVMAVHELGHLASMALFGYRNFQVLFFPLFVDTTRDEESSPEIWKQVAVYLMGPIPGIIIGLIILGLSQEYLVGWLYETALVFLVINYINLLPITPLDGGHLIRFTVLERFPSGKLILTGMSAIAFAAGAWYLGEPVFWILAIILLSTLPWSALEAGVLSELFQPTNDFEKLDREKRLQCLFETFRQSRYQKLQYLQKFNLIKGLSDTLLTPRPLGRLGALGFNAIYFGALILTPPAAIITLIGMDNTVEIVAKIQGEPVEKNWDTIIDNANNPTEKFSTSLKAARFYTTTNNYGRAQSFLERAEKILPLIYSETHLSRLYQTYTYYYLGKLELGTAEEYQTKVIKLLDQNTDDNAFELATSYQNLANIHEQQNTSNPLLDLKTGLSYALTIKSPEERYVIISVLNQLLNQYYESAEFEKIKSILLDSLSILNRYNDAPSKYVAAFIYQELGWLSVNTNNLSYSIKQFEKALTLSDENILRIVDISQYGYDPFTRVNIYLAMAVVQNKAGNINSAKDFMHMAESILKTNFTESLSEYVKTNSPDNSQPQDGTKTNDSIETNRVAQRWQMISTLLENITTNTQTLELPKSRPVEKSPKEIDNDPLPTTTGTRPDSTNDIIETQTGIPDNPQSTIGSDPSVTNVENKELKSITAETDKQNDASTDNLSTINLPEPGDEKPRLPKSITTQ